MDIGIGARIVTNGSPILLNVGGVAVQRTPSAHAAEY